MRRYGVMFQMGRLDALLLNIRWFIISIGVVVITVAAVRSVFQLIQLVLYRKLTTNYIRLQFGYSVILGMEFMVGADIIGSLADPDYYSLGLLGILVLIRTVLSYFLSLELEALTPKQRQAFK